MRNRTCFELAMVLALFVARPASAWFHIELALDRLCNESAVILKVSATDFRALDCCSPDIPMISFVAETLATIKSDGLPVPTPQTIETVGTIDGELLRWAKIPETERAFLLFLDRDSEGALHILNDSHGMLPVSKSEPSEAGITAKPQRRLFDEFRNTVALNSTPEIKTKYIAFMAAVATRDELDCVDHVASGNGELMDLTLKLLAARLDPDPARMGPIIEILKQKLPAIEGMGPEISGVIFQDVEDAARCGHVGMEEPVVARARGYLSLYRYLVDTAVIGDDRVVQRGLYIGGGLDALAAIGTRDDLLRLWRYCEGGRDWERHEALEGLSRILGCPTKRPFIRSYGAETPLSDDVRKWEADTLERVQRLMTEQGLLAAR